MSVELKLDIKKSFGDFTLKVKQSFPLSGVTAIFGPSGAGKSSLLKLIAGFEKPESGRISLDQKYFFDSKSNINVPPHKRAVGYMFQDGRLFPHLTVIQNLEFSAKRASKKISISNVVSAFGIDALLDKFPSTLSGGEQRRVALARTVLTGPDVLLLDEPLTGLDRARKREILPFIENLSKDFNIPCLYVTHDIEEVSRLADKVLLMSEGHVLAFGEAVDVLSHLDTTPLLSEYDVSSLFEGQITAYDERLHMMQADIDGVKIFLPQINGANIGETLRLRVRASDVAVALAPPKRTSIRNIIQVEILNIVEDKASSHGIITLKFSNQKLHARITRAATQDLGLKENMTVWALIKSVSFEGRL